jgi:uncharacterized protein (DUF2249 family)
MNTTSAPTVIDVRKITPRERLETLVAAFRDLGVGDSLEIVDDHDPQALHHRLQAEASADFSWGPLQNGPEVWRVSLRKLAPAPEAAGCCGHCGGRGLTA